MVEAAERGDFAAARAIHARILPLMQVNFVEVEPGAGQGRDGGDGPARGGLPAADVSAEAGVEGEDPEGAEEPRSAERRARVAARSHRIMLEDRHPDAGGRRRVGRSRRRRATRSRGCARRCRPAPSAPPSPMRRARRLAREHVGEAGHPARVQVRRDRRRVDGSRPLAVLRQGHAAAEEARAGGRRPHRARRIGGARRRVHRARRHLHAADVHQHRRVCRRAIADRLARAGRIVRAGRRPRARQRRRRRSAA